MDSVTKRVLAIFLYPNMTTLDFVGPHEVLSRIPGMEVKKVAKVKGPVTADTGLQIVADYSIDEVSEADLLLIPGGTDTFTSMEDKAVVDWVKKIDTTTGRTVSVCTGSLLLAKAGLLEGRPATTHWATLDMLKEFGAEPMQERMVESGKYLTAAGVSAGIDMGLALTAQLTNDDFAQLMQLFIEYDPAPPFNAGSPKTAPAHILEMAKTTFGVQ
ncbi:DJ-1/PfpI family protein [Maricurvus nonylphenolicus]|uniref:DJ-1/PfpI family protein n=1 Tax=Maricurvus nonylphenolicus TaxID=1008307 RepID=UPI0036F31B91